MNRRQKRRQRVNPFTRRRSKQSGKLRPPVMRIAHRGASGGGLAPENTMAAVEKALDIGVDLVEIDIHLTADGHPVVIHDRMVDRTTNGAGYVDTLTLAQVRDLDAGSWLDLAFRGERVPTLAEVLDLCRRRALVLVEAKTVEAAEEAAVLVRSWRDIGLTDVAERVSLPACFHLGGSVGHSAGSSDTDGIFDDGWRGGFEAKNRGGSTGVEIGGKCAGLEASGSPARAGGGVFDPGDGILGVYGG